MMFSYVPVVGAETRPVVERHFHAEPEALVHARDVLRVVVGPMRAGSAYLTVFAGAPERGDWLGFWDWALGNPEPVWRERLR